MALNAIVEPGDLEAARLVADYGAADVWQAVQKGTPKRWAARARRVSVTQIRRCAELNRVRFIIPGDDEWTRVLDELDRVEPLTGRGAAPLGLWLRGAGDLADLVTRCDWHVAELNLAL